MPDSGGERVIRIRVRGTYDTREDRDALGEWLAQEEWLEDRRQKGELRLEKPSGAVAGGWRDPYDGKDGPAMSGPVSDVLLIVVAAALQPVFDDLYRSVKASVATWRDNRRVTRTGGEDPEVDIHTDETPEGGGPGDGLEDGPEPGRDEG